MSALRINDMVALTFTTVLDELPLGLVDEDEEVAAVADREYWVNKATKATVALADRLFGMIKEFAPDNELKYNKFYIGLASDGQPNNFAIFKPRKNNVNLEIRLAEAEELTQRIEDAGLDVMDYEKRWGKYRIRLTKTDIDKHEELLTELMQLAFQESNA